jgi:hypothetical protein
MGYFGLVLSDVVFLDAVERETILHFQSFVRYSRL